MKTILPVLFLAFLITSMPAQYPPIGVIDFYGLRQITKAQGLEALQVKEGENITDEKKAAALKRLTALPGIEEARISSVCCFGGKTILYVGIKEKGAPVLRFRPVSNGSVKLPGEIIKAGQDFSIAHRKAVLAGDAGEDTASGHSLMRNPTARAAQEKYVIIARRNLKLLRRVLYESAEPQHRALAAEIIAYSIDKRNIVSDLVGAMSDPDGAVRNNAMRALGLIAELAAKKTEQKITVPFSPFIGMLNSLEWTDRNKASLALLRLTEKRDQKLLAELRKKALPALIEMARWKDPGHYMAPFIILARVGHMTEEEIQKAIETNRRETLIERAVKSKD